MQIEVLSPPLAADRKTLGSRPFAILSSQSAALTSLPPSHSALLATEANRWTGRNFQGYSNPRVDDLMDRLLVTLDERSQPPNGELRACGCRALA